MTHRDFMILVRLMGKNIEPHFSFTSQRKIFSLDFVKGLGSSNYELADESNIKNQ